jgi:hypothetical protein
MMYDYSLWKALTMCCVTIYGNTVLYRTGDHQRSFPSAPSLSTCTPGLALLTIMPKSSKRRALNLGRFAVKKVRQPAKLRRAAIERTLQAKRIDGTSDGVSDAGSNAEHSPSEWEDIEEPPASRSPSPTRSVDIHSTTSSVLSVVSLTDELPAVANITMKTGKLSTWLTTANARLAQLVSIAMTPLGREGPRGPYIKSGVQAPRTERRKRAEVRKIVAEHGVRPLDAFFKPRPKNTLAEVDVIELDGDEEVNGPAGAVSTEDGQLGLKSVLNAAAALRERTTEVWDDEALEGGRPAVYADGIDGLWGDGDEDDLLAQAVRMNALRASASRAGGVVTTRSPGGLRGADWG